MGRSLEQILAEAVDGSSIGITIVSNQDNGLVGYAVGSLLYHPASVLFQFPRPARLSTTGGEPLKFYFSDRRLDIDGPPPEGGFGHTPRQPFSANAVDQLGVSLSLFSLNPLAVRLTFITWGGVNISMSMQPFGDMYVGLGPTLGGDSPHAAWLISFTGLSNPPH